MNAILSGLIAASKFIGLAESLITYLQSLRDQNAGRALAAAQALQARQQASTEAHQTQSGQDQKSAQDQTDAAFDPDFFRKGDA